MTVSLFLAAAIAAVFLTWCGRAGAAAGAREARELLDREAAAARHNARFAAPTARRP